MTNDKPTVLSLIIVGFMSAENEIATAFSSVRQQCESEGLELETVYVVNDLEPTALPADIVISGHGNVGFAKANRLGLEASRGSLVLFLNPDSTPTKGSLKLLLAALRLPRQIVAPLILDAKGLPDTAAYRDWTYTPGRLWSGFVASRTLNRTTATQIPRAMKLPGAALMMRRELAIELGPFDTDYFLYAEDRDLSRRARKSSVVQTLVTSSVFIHEGGVSSASVPDLVIRAQTDGALRIAFRRFGRVGALLAALDILIVDWIKHPRSPTRAKRKILALWRTRGWADRPASRFLLEEA